MYSSAVYKHKDMTLEEASDYKKELICQKLQLKPMDHLVEIGSGWGGFAIYAAQHYGCKVTTITISQAQYDEATKRIADAGLSHRVNVQLKDYRLLEGKFDKLVSIEMIEAVGEQYLSTYFNKCRSLLKPNGLGLIQAITIEDARYKKALNTVDYIKRYIFPGSFIPCISVLTQAASEQQLRLKHLEDIGLSYAETIHQWRERFLNAKERVLALGFDENFIRMWDFYLCYCEGGFKEGVISDVHLLFEASPY
ncbi:SAM-dependent methyltransferase, partial [Acinetobacter junii]